MSFIDEFRKDRKARAEYRDIHNKLKSDDFELV